MTRSSTFRWIRMGGLLALIPVILASGPLAGYLAGDWLVGYFGLPRLTTVLCVIIGFAASGRETIKVIKLAIKTSQEIE